MRSPPIKVYTCEILAPMEVATGVSVSTMGEATYYKLWPRRGLSRTNLKLPTYSKQPIVVGSADVQVSYQGRTAQLPPIVVKGDGPTLYEISLLRIKLKAHLHGSCTSEAIILS